MEILRNNDDHRIQAAIQRVHTMQQAAQNRRVYIIMNHDGQVLANRNADGNLHFVDPAMMEETGETAMTFDNPHYLSQQVRNRLDSACCVMETWIGPRDHGADSMAVIESRPMGPVLALLTGMPETPRTQDRRLWGV